MNIFVLDNSPVIAAQSLCDKHVPKMLLETAQLLCNPFQNAAPYKPTHMNHPCSVWTRQTLSNYEWLLRYGSTLSLEYTFRFGKIHASSEVVKWCILNVTGLNLPELGVSPFALAMPEEFKVRGDPVQSYRNYYIGDKSRFAAWNRGRPAPKWWGRA